MAKDRPLMTDDAVTLNEGLASAIDAIDTSQGAAGASVGRLKSAPHVLRVDFPERHSALLDLAQASGDFDVRLERLAVGDYFVGAGVLVERKTYADFAMSLVDGHSSPRRLRLLEAHIALSSCSKVRGHIEEDLHASGTARRRSSAGASPAASLWHGGACHHGRRDHAHAGSWSWAHEGATDQRDRFLRSTS